MTTVDGRNYSKTFTGLKSTAITAGAFIVGGILVKEIFQRMNRYPDEDKARKEGKEGVPDRGGEGFALGYVYRARSYVAGPKTPDYPKAPLGWLVQAYKNTEAFYEVHAGADATVYIRFLRGTFFWMAFLLVFVFPVLTGINYVYAASSFNFDSIDRVSLTALVTGKRGMNLLPIHVTVVWLVTLSWLITLFWVGRGALRVRRNELRRLLRDDAARMQLPEGASYPEDCSPELDPSIPQGDLGWRYRTVLVRNIPLELRSEEALRRHFEERFSAPSPTAPPPTYPPKSSDDKTPPSTESSTIAEELPLVAEVVLVRRQTEVNELWAKYQAVAFELESAHTALARNVVQWVRERVEQEERLKKGEAAPEKQQSSRWKFWQSTEKRGAGRSEPDVENEAQPGDALLIDTMRPYLTRPSSLAPVHETIWEALEGLRRTDPTILDRFQPRFRLRHFRSATVPAIDYHLTKHNLLFSLIEDQRARVDEIEPASTAFITFSRAADARRVRAKLSASKLDRLRRGKVFQLQGKLAPENRDLHWQRLVLVSLSSDILRSTILNGAIWALTLIWILPISLLIGLFNLESLQQRLPGLATWLGTHDVARSLFTGLLPTAIITLLNMYTSTVIGIAKRKGLTLITESKWSAETQSAYWKFMVVNLLIVFCIGITAFSAALNAFNSPVSLFKVVAAAFPKGATFFVSYVLLQVGVQCGIELSLFGISWINHISIRKYLAPRKRASEGEPRFFGYQSVVPNHLFMVSVVLVFAILNPIVIAFAFLYFGIILLVFKQQFAHVYYRRNFESGGRQVFRRFFRYSLDIAVLSQVVAVAFFWTLSRFGLGGACIPLIPITVFCKLVGTRWFDKLMDELDEAKIDLVCGENDPAAALSTPLDLREEDGNERITPAAAFRMLKNFALVTLPALLRKPADRLPQIGQQVRLATHWKKGRRPLRPKAVRHRSSRYNKQPANDNDDRPMLDEPVPEDTQGGVEASADGEVRHVVESPRLQAAAAVPRADGDMVDEATPAQTALAFAYGNAPEAPEQTEPDALVTPHAPLIRDDRPVSHLRYRNPAVHAPLLRALWLPRDPLQPVDLQDTVDLHAAFVSSSGGRGVIGSWDEIDTVTGDSTDESGEDKSEDKKQAPDADAGPPASPQEMAEVQRSASNASLSPPSLRRRRSSSQDPLGLQPDPTVGSPQRLWQDFGGGGHSGGTTSTALAPPVLAVDPNFTLAPSVGGLPGPRTPTSVPLPPSPATPLSKTGPPSLHLTLTPSQRPRSERSSPSSPAVPGSAGATAASPARSTLSGLDRILSGTSSHHTAGSPGGTTRTRRSRSGSHATGASTVRSRTWRSRREASSPLADVDEEGELPPVSQAEAMRNELIEEERKRHEAHRAKDEARRKREQEEADARAGSGRGGLWRKVMLWHDESVLSDDT